ncbi:D-alanyl-D-alanine carboxypeptidase family protein [Pseudonocardia sp. N23]|uniref:D-alanyl-D-alanine carboxypeptidase family protein n=1 Tax=Pseudonocardia sp. N23 TaxID=1987376 RepID=UPI000C027D4E|nr:D-alanyl-D-alanine carboxypeptidase family protein [Pseudonocardia sp. N23]GAY08447.1 D-alanyl-D-alanine carboxypeptidase family [Pseudonocardia sp. N23]
MTRSPTAARTTGALLIGGLLAVAAAFLLLSPTSPPASPPRVERPTEQSGGWRGALPGPADGVVPDGVTVFDDVPAVSNLDPDLLGALRRAARDAAGDGIGFAVNSGWRSPAYQEQLLREAVAQHGSQAEAARWVATVATSPHVSGDAVDLGGAEATAWLAENGATYGLCRVYRNEPWHYELHADAADRGCPRMYADPTQDPRMAQ